MNGLKSNIALIGMMGTFKSSAGKKLANSLDMLFLDTDELIEFEYNMKISQIFKEYGEGFFRELESRIIRRVSGYDNVVISTGGGVVLNPANMDALAENAYIVLLTASAEEIYSRISGGNNRPLGKSLQDIERLLSERDAFYKSRADITIDNTKSTSAQTAEEVEKRLAEFIRLG